MNKYFLTLFFACFGLAHAAFSQDDLLALLADSTKPEPTFVRSTFKNTRIINGHSVENVAQGVMEYRISHRFGFINTGFYDLFGLDNALMRNGFGYGLTENLEIGIGRSNFAKFYDGYVKYKLLRQQTGIKEIPVSVSYLATIAITARRFPDPNAENKFSSRIYYTHQVLVARKFSDRFSAQLTPTLVHRNAVDFRTEKNDIYAVGFGGRYKVTNRIAINGEYFYVLPNQLAAGLRNSAALGVDIETGGHVFQLHFTNSTSMIEQGFITQTTGKWLDGGIHFGFNVSRVFTLRDRKNKS